MVNMQVFTQRNKKGAQLNSWDDFKQEGNFAKISA